MAAHDRHRHQDHPARHAGQQPRSKTEMSKTIIDADLIEIILSHSPNCPFGGGFWVHSEEASCGCDDDGCPICTCGGFVYLKFSDGSEVTVERGNQFMRNLSRDYAPLMRNLIYGKPAFSSEQQEKACQPF
jgi:hypothetical protein